MKITILSSQYVDAPDKNVLFYLEVDDSIVQFSID